MAVVYTHLLPDGHVRVTFDSHCSHSIATLKFDAIYYHDLEDYYAGESSIFPTPLDTPYGFIETQWRSAQLKEWSLVPALCFENDIYGTTDSYDYLSTSSEDGGGRYKRFRGKHTSIQRTPADDHESADDDPPFYLSEYDQWKPQNPVNG